VVNAFEKFGNGRFGNIFLLPNLLLPGWCKAVGAGGLLGVQLVVAWQLVPRLHHKLEGVYTLKITIPLI
jgi:hypothetical protein